MVVRRPVRATAKPPAEPEVIVPPDQAAAVHSYMASIQDRRVVAFRTLEPPLPFAPTTIEVGTLDDLPRLSTSDMRPAEPLPPLNRLVTGGEL